MKSVDSIFKKTGIVAKATNLISCLSKQKPDESPKETQKELQLISLVDKYRGIPELVNRGRKQEIQDVFDILQKKLQHNIVLLGPFGVGKHSIVEGVAERIAKGMCPESFKGTKIVQLLAEELNPQLFGFDQIESKIAGVVTYLKDNPDAILYVREFNLIVEYGLLEHFKLIFQNFRFISTIDTTKYEEKFFEEDQFMLTYFEILNIDEPPREELYEMLQYPINQLIKHHGVTICKEDVELIMDIIYRKKFEIFPWDVVNTIDYVMGVCKNHGLNRVNAKSIFEQSRHYIADFLEMPPEKVKIIAYHEVGHCIVGKACGIKFHGIQIIPSSDSLGSNFFNFGLPGVISRTDYINIICTYLAGELSTKRKGYETIDGISGDIAKASAYARSMVTAFGMEDLHLMSYVVQDQIGGIYFSDQIREKIDTKARDILRDAIEKTQKILEENSEKIELLVSALLKKGFLTTAEVEGLLAEAETGKKISIDSLPSIQELLFDE